jgi:uncharacterized protein (UPF0335 family)
MNDERIERLENELKTINERIERLEQSQARNIDQLDDKYTTREQYAKTHKITPRTVDRYIATGKLKAIKAFNRVLIPLDQNTPPE